MSTVLVVQSDPRLIDSWCSALEAASHEVLASTAFTEGIKRVREGGIDVVIVDSELGGFTEFVAELLLLPDPPPFVMASSSPQAPEQSAHYGASGFLPKPCADAELQSMVSRLTLGVGSSPRLPIIPDTPTLPLRRPTNKPAPADLIDDEPTSPRAKSPLPD